MVNNKTRRRSKAGLWVWQERQKRMLPRAYAFLAFLILYLVLAILSLAGYLPLWVSMALIPAILTAQFMFNKYTDPIDARWGEGARGEFLVGAELERLHEQGFHIFHDWNSGEGNVDHFVVGPQGVFAVETKAWSGKISSKDGNLLKNDKPIHNNAPVKQAMGNAMKVRKLITDSCGIEPFVRPVLCFSKATVSFYQPVGKVEVVHVGSLNRTIANRQEVYSSQEVKAISQLLEKSLSMGPAAKPGLPPEEPTRAKKLLDRALSLSDSSFVLILLGILFLVSLAFPTQAFKVFLGVAYLYHLLGEIWRSLF